MSVAAARTDAIAIRSGRQCVMSNASYQYAYHEPRAAAAGGGGGGRGAARRRAPLVRVLLIPPLVLLPLPVLTLSIGTPLRALLVGALVSCTAAALLSLYCTLMLDPGFIRVRGRDGYECNDDECADSEDGDVLVAALRRGTS